MAFPYAEINSFAKNHVRPIIVDQIYKGNVLPKRLMERNRIQVSGGQTIRQVVQYDKLNGGTWDGATDIIATSYKKTHDYAELDWKFYHSEAMLTRKDVIMASGPEQIFDLVKTRMGEIKAKMVDQLGTDFYSNSADGDATINGLRQSIDTGNTYAGIAQGTYTWWKAAQEDSTTTTITYNKLATMWNTIVNNSTGETPTILTTTSTIYTALLDLFQPQQRFQNADQANVGWPSLVFHGVPCVLDPKCPASHLFMLNENHIKFWVSDKMNFEFTGWQTPINQPGADIAYMLLGCNMLVDMPGSSGKFTAITG